MRRLLIALGLSASLLGCGPSGGTLTSSTTPNNVVAQDPTGPDQALPDGPRSNGPWIGAAAASDAFVPGMQETFVAVWVDVPNSSQSGAHAPAAVILARLRA